LLLNNFGRLSICALVAKICPDKVVRWWPDDDFGEFLDNYWNYLELLGTTSNYMELLGTTWNTWNYLELIGTTFNYLELLSTTWNYFQLL